MCLKRILGPFCTLFLIEFHRVPAEEEVASSASPFPIVDCVPQGSVVAPLLFYFPASIAHSRSSAWSVSCPLLADCLGFARFVAEVL